MNCGYKYLYSNLKTTLDGPAPTPENKNETKKEENKIEKKKEDKNNIVLEHKDFKRDKKKKSCC